MNPDDDAGLGTRPQADELSRAVRRSRVGNSCSVPTSRYQLLERVGSGGVGVVWGAWDPELERRVAIKLVKPTLAAACERIVAEAQALAKLSHPMSCLFTTSAYLASRSTSSGVGERARRCARTARSDRCARSSRCTARLPKGSMRRMRPVEKPPRNL